MAIELDCISILIRKSEIDSKYPGGLIRFRLDWMDRPAGWYEDGHLVAQTHMGHYYDEIMRRMQAVGISVGVGDEASGLGT